MSTEKNEKPASSASPRRPEAVAVRMLKFPTGGYRDIPGKNAASSVTAGEPKGGQSYYTIEFQPWWRHHRIAFYAAGDGEREPTIAMIHESHVSSWEPA